MARKILGDTFNLDAEERSKYVLIGVSSLMPAYKIIHEINKIFHLNISKEDDISFTIRKKENLKNTPFLFSPEEIEFSSSFPFYYFEGESGWEKIAIIKNFNGGTFLINGKITPDYIIIVFGSAEAGKHADEMLPELQAIPDIQSVFYLDFVKQTIINDILLDLEDHIDVICKKPSLKEIQKKNSKDD